MVTPTCSWDSSRYERWDAGYEELLDLIPPPSLEQRRIARQLFKIIHGLCYFPDDVLGIGSILLPAGVWIPWLRFNRLLKQMVFIIILYHTLFPCGIHLLLIRLMLHLCLRLSVQFNTEEFIIYGGCTCLNTTFSPFYLYIRLVCIGYTLVLAYCYCVSIASCFVMEKNK